MADKSRPYDEGSRKKDNVQRGIKTPSPAGTATFFTGRLLDPLLQWNILSKNVGSSLIERLGGSTLPHGPPLVTNTPLDAIVGLSPYRTILWSMSVGSMLKQNLTLLAVMQEQMPVTSGAVIAAFNAVMNSLNSLFFICTQTSASVNGEHFPQTPLIVGSSMYVLGLTLELASETQRHMWKKDPANKGKVYQGGLFGLSRHVNYFGYTMWRTGYALAAGGWTWAGVVAAFFTYDFTQRGIPVLQHYLEEKYGDQYEHYEKSVPYKFIPFVW